MAQVLAINPIALPLFVAPLVVAQQLYSRYAALKSAYVDTVRSLVGALEAKDPYTRGHSERVAEYAAGIGAALGLDSRSQERLAYAALLHDLGKLEVPSRVLTKPGRLDYDETEAIRGHPARGAEMVSRIPPLRDLAEFVRLHHEWYGGGGYPKGLDSKDIPQSALILAVADCYDAMTTTRAYRPAMPREAAVAELIRCAGTQFDPVIVRAFIEARIGATDAVAADGCHEDQTSGAVAAGEM
jgi:HD-GYP domain-containing protein (c-di-GMP phosphodiesterase class II)